MDLCVLDFPAGCDPSLLLRTVPNSASKLEQDVGANDDTLRGLEIIDQEKAKLEAACPNTISQFWSRLGNSDSVFNRQNFGAKFSRNNSQMAIRCTVN
ncbi:hypothetical protein L1887_30921 [Cichorium endivia]|nr:hypothetical protein L1887_30921 [Cichorium endivia]